MKLRVIGCCALLWLLTACGWQLQGAHRIPEFVVPLYLELDDAHSPFARALTERLQQAGVTVAQERAQGQTVLKVTRDLSGHHVSSVSALNEPQQYEVFYNIQYQVDSVTQGVGNLLPSQPINTSRTMSYDKTLALAKQREELAIRDTLAGEIADQVMRRLSMIQPKAAAN